MSRAGNWATACMAVGIAACGYPSLTPVARDGGTDDVDSPVAIASSGDRLAFSLGDFRLAKNQVVPLHVLLTHTDGATMDVTSSAQYASDAAQYASLDQNRVIGGSAGNATITASYADAQPATLRTTTNLTQCHPVINEIQTGSVVNGPADEWVEIYNPCFMSVSVDGWTLDYRALNSNATGPDSTSLVTLAGAMSPGEFRVYAGSAYTGPSEGQWTSGIAIEGSVGLRAGAADTGTIVDAVAYGVVDPTNPFIENTPFTAIQSSVSAARRAFDGNDTDNNAVDFALAAAPTPGAPNMP